LPAAGFEDRHQLYQLYHYLNHTVLFGGGYAGTSQRIMEGLLKKL
jgi:protein-ribulosamine 3-kinase